MQEDHIRQAKFSDLAALVELSELKRIAYQRYQPAFWRKAENSREAQIAYFEKIMDQ